MVSDKSGEGVPLKGFCKSTMSKEEATIGPSTLESIKLSASVAPEVKITIALFGAEEMSY